MFDIKKQIMWSKLKVGIVITVTLLILFFTIFFAGGLEEFLSPKVEIEAHIKDVRGLRNGSPVWIAGIEIGSVKNMKLHEKYGTLVTLSIKEDLLNFIKNDSKVTVQTMGLLGDKYVEISAGSPHAMPIKKGDIIEGKPQLEIKDLVDASAGSIDKITHFIGKLDIFIEKIEKSEGTVGKLISDPSLYQNLSESTKRLTIILKDVEKSNGTFSMLIKDPSLYNKLLSTTERIDDLTLRINEGEGTIGKLISDPALYDNLNEASIKLTKLIHDIDNEGGVAGTLLKDKELAKELKQTVVNLREVLDDLKLLTKDIREQPKRYFKFSIF